jgi:demethylmenaquinone methyltransferase / 2-methoxy-6-polyprenyl-1,4-benzoquinol methylase
MEEFKQTNFGFQEVSSSEKTRRVTDVFHRVARRYDLMNDVMSTGIHRLWKDQFIRMMNPVGEVHLLDVAGGTGDIAFRFLEACAQGSVTICDINPGMIEQGRDRALDRGITKRLKWVCGDASALPFEDASFDFYSISFGLRNVTFRIKALEEAFRVLKPGGQFFCLEFSKVQLPGLKELYHFYSFSLIPRLGAWIARDRDAYQYLVESIAQFPDQAQLEKEVRAAGFDNVKFHNLSAGIAAIHQGIKRAGACASGK